MARLEGKVAIVTGAGSGIGRACLELFAAEGAKVVGASRTVSKVEEAVAAVRAKGGQAIAVKADLTQEEDVDAVVKAALAEYGKIDIMVHAAGVGYSLKDTVEGSMDPVGTTTLKNWRLVMSANLESCFLMGRAVIPAMTANGGGAIVNVASILGLIGNADAHAYTATKGAVINLTRSMCVTYAKDNIRVNCVAPGWIDTPMIASVMYVFDDDKTAGQISPMKRAGTPMEIAYSCLFLASDESSFCTGSILVADGGTIAQG